MEQYPPKDWTTPKAKREKRGKREKLNLSSPASDAFDELRRHLAEHSAWLESTTASVLIEFLCWHYHRTKAGFKGFRPATRRGRPAGPNETDNFRPANVRKAAGLSKADAMLGPELPDG